MKKIFSLLMVIFLASCATTKIGSPISYQVLTDSNYMGKKKQTYEVIDNHDDLNKLYKTVKDDLVPNIDFADYRIVALHMGELNTGGYSIGIEEVTQGKGKVIVKIKKTYPNGNVTMAFTQPYVIAKIKTTQKIEFIE